MKRLTILFTLFIILIIVLADAGQLGMLAIIYRIPYADKAGHFILYGVLALLINLTLLRSLPAQNRTRIALISVLILAFLIGIEEFSQQSFSSRTFSLSDLTASYLGLIFFSWLAVRTEGRKD
jgi:polysaccharide biosynthesis protein VpsQ